jgi:hypothetical protein
VPAAMLAWHQDSLLSAVNSRASSETSHAAASSRPFGSSPDKLLI